MEEKRKRNTSVLGIIIIAAIVIVAAIGSPFLFSLFDEKRGEFTLGVSDGWQLVEQKEMKLEGFEGLHYAVWEKERLPYEDYDRIRLYRVAAADGAPKGAVFILPGTWMSGEQIASEDLFLTVLSSAEEAVKREPDNDSYRSYLGEIKADIETMPTRSIVHFLALNGYEVYTMDYRTHFVPATMQPDELDFMVDWGWDMFMNDTREAITHAKRISSFEKVWLGGQSFGGMLAMNYASEYGEEDVNGLILLDGGNAGNWKIRIPLEIWRLIDIPLINMYLIDILPDISFGSTELVPGIMQSLIDGLGRDLIYTFGMYSLDLAMEFGPLNGPLELMMNFLKMIGLPLSLYHVPNYADVREYAITHLFEEPRDPITGEYLKPYNPETGEPFPTYLDWAAELVYEDTLKGIFTNYPAGENTRPALAYLAASLDRYWPLEIYLESIRQFDFELSSSDEVLELLDIHINPLKLPGALAKTIFDGVDMLISGDINVDMDKKELPEIAGPSFAFDYSTIDVPLISFSSRLGLMLWGPYEPAIKNDDVTNGGAYPEIGHLDVYYGINNYELINKPTLDWLNKKVT